MAAPIPVPAHLQGYVDYIRNTGQVPLETRDFDEDWDPIGPQIRSDLLRLGIIEECQGALALELGVPDARV